MFSYNYYYKIGYKFFLHEFMLFQNSSLLFQVVQLFKCWRIFLEMSSKGLYQSFNKELENWHCSCVHVLQKREFRQIHVVVVQRLQRNVQKACYTCENLLLSWESRRRCRCRRRLHPCISPLMSLEWTRLLHCQSTSLASIHGQKPSFKVLFKLTSSKSQS